MTPFPVSALMFGAALAALASSDALAQAQPLGGLGAGGLNSSTSSLIIDQQRQDRLPAAPIPSSPLPKAPSMPILPPEQTAPNTPLAQVRVIGSSLNPAQLKAAWQAYVGKPLNGENIQALATAIQAAYARSDVALYTIVIPSQTMAGGDLIIQATEGYLTNVVISGDVAQPDIRLVRRYAAKLAAEKPLHRHSLERYLSLARDIPGLTVDAQLHTAQTPGGVILTLDLKQKRLQTEVAVSDNGNPALGETQIQGTLIVNGALTPGDQVRATIAVPTEINPFQYYSLAYTTRLGTDGMNITGSIGELFTRPRGVTPATSGSATTIGLVLNYPLIRSYQQNLYLSLGLDGQNNDNAYYGAGDYESLYESLFKDHTRAVRGSFSWTRATDTRVIAVNGTASIGLNILGAQGNPVLTDPTFDKINGQIGVDQAIGRQYVLRLRGTAQGSWGLLPGSEQFSLGGDQFGRAFPSAYVLGDYGAAGSMELGWRSASLWPRMLRGSELYGFADGGFVTSRPRVLGLLPLTTYDLASSGLGVRFDIYDKVVVGVEAARAVYDPLPGGSPWRILFSWRSLL
jgi:hemolysin activation/secretion protein